MVYAQLMWAGSMGALGGSTATACGTQGAASRPTGMPTSATPANTSVQLTVGSASTVSVAPDRENEDDKTALAANNQQFYSAAANVTSAFASVPTGSAVTVSAANVFAYQGYYLGILPPGHRSRKDLLRVYTGLAHSHIAAYGRIHALRQNARVGVANHLHVFDPAHPRNPFDRSD